MIGTLANALDKMPRCKCMRARILHTAIIRTCTSTPAAMDCSIHNLFKPTHTHTHTYTHTHTASCVEYARSLTPRTDR